MAIDGKDLGLVIKMLGMTTSDNPNQVLVAINKANEKLRSLDLTWTELFQGKLTVLGDPFAGLDTPPPRRAAPPPKPAPPTYNPFNTPFHVGGVPPQSPAQPQAQPKAASASAPKPKKNFYPGTCYVCHAHVPAGVGWFSGGVKCDSCQYPIKQPTPQQKSQFTQSPAAKSKKRGVANIDDLLI